MAHSMWKSQFKSVYRTIYSCNYKHYKLHNWKLRAITNDSTNSDVLLKLFRPHIDFEVYIFHLSEYNILKNIKFTFGVYARYS